MGRLLASRRRAILIVDDVRANLMALEAVLQPLGHRLVRARSGDEALRALLQQEFTLILMDVQMPELDGFQTVALIKQRPTTANVPVMFVTAIAREASTSRAAIATAPSTTSPSPSTRT